MKHQMKSLLALFMQSGWLCLVPAGMLFATDAISQPAGQGIVQEEQSLRQESGSFGGYNKKTGRFWVGDRVYQFDTKLKVTGTSKKLGLLSDIRQGELVVVHFLMRSVEIPFAFEVKRQ